MNYTLQLHSNNRTYPVPRGLHDLMADIAREVLRHKPMQIEKFIYKYLDSLMKIKRVAKGVAPEVDKTIYTGAKKTKMLHDLGLTLDQADNAAARLQALVRGHMARKHFKDLIDKKDSVKVSLHDVSYMTSKILKKYNLTAAQANTICTKIQAAFRGWLVRRKSICNVPSHESWRHDWLWKEFQMSPSEVKAVTRTEKKSHSKGDELLFQPRRSIEIDHIKFMRAFKGELADYDDKSDTSSIGDTTPSEEESEEKQIEPEEKQIEPEEEKVPEKPQVIEENIHEKEEMVEEGQEEQEEFMQESPNKTVIEENIHEKEVMVEEGQEEQEELMEESPNKTSLTNLSIEPSGESEYKPEIIEKLEKEKLPEVYEEDTEGREFLSESEHGEEKVDEEQEYIMSEYEPFVEEEQEVFATSNIDNVGPEEVEFYFDNKFGDVEEIEPEEINEEE